MSASIREQLPPHCRDAWDRIWARLLTPIQDDPSDQPDPKPITEEEQPERAA